MFAKNRQRLTVFAECCSLVVMEKTEDKPSTLNVSLAPELVRFVRSRVKSGFYTSASEVVREALRLLVRAEATADGSGLYPFDRGSVEKAIEDLKRSRQGRKLGPDLTIRDLIDEGRR